MREVRLTGLDKVEATDDEVRIFANSGELVLVFPRVLFDDAIELASSTAEPTVEELEELDVLLQRLKQHARENSFATVLEEVPFGSEGSEGRFDLVLRPGGMFAATTGYLFLPVVSSQHMVRFGEDLEGDTFVEQAYVIGAVAEDQALAAGNETLKALSIRGRRCSSSRFELPPELWQVLSEDLGWKNVEPVTAAIDAEDGRKG